VVINICLICAVLGSFLTVYNSGVAISAQHYASVLEASNESHFDLAGYIRQSLAHHSLPTYRPVNFPDSMVLLVAICLMLLIVAFLRSRYPLHAMCHIRAWLICGHMVWVVFKIVGLPGELIHHFLSSSSVAIVVLVFSLLVCVARRYGSGRVLVAVAIPLMAVPHIFTTGYAEVEAYEIVSPWDCQAVFSIHRYSIADLPWLQDVLTRGGKVLDLTVRDCCSGSFSGLALQTNMNNLPWFRTQSSLCEISVPEDVANYDLVLLYEEDNVANPILGQVSLLLRNGSFGFGEARRVAVNSRPVLVYFRGDY